MYQIQFKNYKISPQKLQDQWKAIWNPPNSCGASSPRATPLATSGFMRRRRQCPEMGGSGLLSSSLPFSVGCEDRRYLQQKKRRNNKF
jgi:hypothetical protein